MTVLDIIMFKKREEILIHLAPGNFSRKRIFYFKEDIHNSWLYFQLQNVSPKGFSQDHQKEEVFKCQRL